jgi:hypothetical protein
MEPICPSKPEHGEMVELFGTGLYFCYGCKCDEWLKRSIRAIREMREAA